MKFAADLVEKNKRVVLAVSGGIDSMVMLHCFLPLIQEKNLSLTVAHVNHGLRKEAKEDALFVEKMCKTWKIQFVLFERDVKKTAKVQKLSVEAAGRAVRRECLTSLTADYIATAHHSGDQAETVLLHLTRGSGMKGACAMTEKNGKWIKPLLFCSKEEILRYAGEFGVPFVEDKTNRQNRFARNKVRNRVLPLLKQINPRAVENICRFVGQLQKEEAYLESLADISSVVFKKDYARIPAECLSDALTARRLQKVLSRLGLGQDISAVHLEALTALIQKESGSALCLPFGWRAYQDYGWVTLQKEDCSLPDGCPLPVRQGVLEAGGQKLSFLPATKEDTLYFDWNKIPPSALLRHRREGDIFSKFGGGTKKLKSVLIDLKINQRERDALWLVADGKQVLLIAGVAVSSSVAVDGSTRKVFAFRVEPTES